MPKKKKINPRHRPATVADVKAVYDLGKRETIEFVIAAACLPVNDVFSPTEEQMATFHGKYKANVSSILDEQIKYADIFSTLKEEYSLELEFA